MKTTIDYFTGSSIHAASLFFRFCVFFLFVVVLPRGVIKVLSNKLMMSVRLHTRTPFRNPFDKTILNVKAETVCFLTVLLMSSAHRDAARKIKLSDSSFSSLILLCRKVL